MKSFGNDELALCPPIQADDTVPCPECGEPCQVRDSDPPSLQFTKCSQGHLYLCGVSGKDIRGK